MIFAHIDEPRRLLLESEFSVCQWDTSRNWGSSLHRREWGSVGVVGGPSIGTCSIRRWSWLFTQQALVRVIGNGKCCQQFLGGNEYRELDKARRHAISLRIISVRGHAISVRRHAISLAIS